MINRMLSGIAAELASLLRSVVQAAFRVKRGGHEGGRHMDQQHRLCLATRARGRAALVLCALVVVPAPAIAQELPSVKLLTAPLVTPTAAWSYYNQFPMTSTAGIAATAQRSPEIKELARALGAGRYTADAYAQTVYEYVRNNIAIDFRFGLSKGARGALIEQSGTAFDQAHLMVELLREGGVTAGYEVGTISLSAAQFGQWTGLVTGLNEAAQTFAVNAAAACQFLADSGIPATVSGAGSCGALSGNLATTGTPVEMAHVWVTANAKKYDPAYKPNLLRAAVASLPTVLQCGTGCGSAVLASVPAATTIGTGVTAVGGVGQAAIGSQLTTYGTRLENWIQTYNATNSTSLTTERLLGGATINISAPLAVGVSLPYPAGIQYSWTGNIPDSFRTFIVFQLDNFTSSGGAPGAGTKLYADETSGGRLRVFGCTACGGGRQLALYLDGRLLARSTLANPPTGDANARVTVTINHPYSAGNGTFADEALYFDPRIQATNWTMTIPIAVVTGYGDTGPAAVSHLAALAERDVVATSWDNPSDPQHITATSQSLDILQQFACQTMGLGATNSAPSVDVGCYEPQLPILGAKWLAQATQTRALIGAVNSTNLRHHHSIGLVTGKTAVATNPLLTMMNIQSSLSVTSTGAVSSDTSSSFMSAAASLSRLEGSVLEQTFDAWEGGSAVSMMTRANEKGIQFVDVTSANVATAIPLLSNYSAPELAVIQQYAALGRLVLPRNRDTGQFCFSFGTSSSCIVFQVGGYAAFNAAGTRASYIAGAFSKGAGSAGSANPATDAIGTTKLADYAIKRRGNFGVNLRNGDPSLSPGPDLVSGLGGYPSSLGFQRVYSRADTSFACTTTNPLPAVFYPSCSTAGPNLSKLGNGGWTHSHAISAQLTSDGAAGLGRDSALQASAAIAALHVVRELNTGTRNLRSDLATTFSAHWLGTKLWNNAVAVDRPPSKSLFVRLPSGAFDGGPGSRERLTQTGSRTMAGFSGGFASNWDALQVSLSLLDEQGAVLALTNGGISLTNTPSTLRSVFLPTMHTFPDGTLVSYGYTTGGSPSPGSILCLASVSNNLGRTLTFTSPCVTATAPVSLTVSDGTRQVVVSIAYPSTTATCPETISVTGTDLGVSRYNYLPEPTTAVNRSPCAIAAWFTPTDQVNPYMSAAFDSLVRVTSLSDNSSVPKTTSYFVAGLYGTENQKAAEVIDPLGAVTRQVFDRWGNALSMTNPLGATTLYGYDDARRRTQMTYPDGNSVRWTYDARHNVRTETKVATPASGLATLVTTTTYVEGPTVVSCVNPNRCNKPATVDGPRGDVTDVTTYTYRTDGQLQRVVAPAVAAGASQVDLCYTATPGTTGTLNLLTGRVESISASATRVARFTYNTPANKLTLQTAVDDPSSTWIAPTTAGGNCTVGTKAGALNLTTTFAFDAVGNVNTIDRPRPGATDFVDYDFDAARRLSRVTSRLGATVQYAVTKYTYDLDGLLTATEKSRISAPSDTSPPDWQKETREYWPTGDLKRVVDAEGNATQYLYDAVGRPTVVTDPDGRRTGTVYDLTGQTLCTWRGWDAATAPTNCTWTPASYAGVGKVRYANYDYTLNGKRRQVIDGNGNVTDYLFDGHDRLRYALFPKPTDGSRCISPANPSSTTSPTCSGTIAADKQTYERYDYDAGGNQTGLVTRAGQSIAWTFDANNRPLTKLAAGLSQVSYEYDRLGNPTRSCFWVSGVGCVTASNLVTDAYDTLGRKASTTRTAGGVSRTIGYQYDEAGNRARTTWPDIAYFVTYDYDDLNRMSLVRELGTTELGRYTYDPLSRRTELRFAGNATNRVNYTYEPDSNLDVLSHTLSATALNLDYGHNASGQINSIVADDDFYLARPAASATVSYSAANALNQYPAVGGSGYTYDLNGNLLTWTAPGGQQNTYTYDSENRLRTAAVNGSTTVTVTYDYDPLGRRHSKTVSGTTTTYLSDEDEEIAEYNGATLLRRYVTGPAVDDRIAMVEGTTRTYFHVNHQGSVLAMTDAAGSTSGTGGLRLAYDAYGNSPVGTPTSGVPFRYTGRRLDPETGLYFYRARYYAPQVGRFLQADPVGQGPDTNLYSYVRNEPVNAVDPTGLAPPGCGSGLCEGVGFWSGVVDGASVASVSGLDGVVDLENGAASATFSGRYGIGFAIGLAGTISANAKGSPNVRRSRASGGTSSTLGIATHEHASTDREGFRAAKRSAGVPTSQNMPHTREGLDERNVRAYKGTTSTGDDVEIRLDKPAEYPDGERGSQPRHFNISVKGKDTRHHVNISPAAPECDGTRSDCVHSPLR